MASGNKGSRPTHYISVTAKVGKGRYEKGPYVGLWEGDDDNGPLFRGSVSGKYLDELADFIKDYGEDSIGFAIFESRGDKGSRGRSRDRDEDRENDRDEDRKSHSRRSSRDEEEDKPKKKRSRNDEDEPRSRKSRDEKEDHGSRKKGGWWDD